MPRGPQVLVRDRETGHEYLISEAKYKRSPQLWERLDQGKPKTSVTEAAAKKATSGHEADSSKEI